MFWTARAPAAVLVIGLAGSGCSFDTSAKARDDGGQMLPVDARTDGPAADAQLVDATGVDAVVADASSADATTDAASADASPADASVVDASVVDASGPDAWMVDAGAPDAGLTLLETLSVDADGTSITSTSILQSGITYRVRASGTVGVTADLRGDAEYWDFSDPPSSAKDSFNDVDFGVAIDDNVVDLNKIPDWGAYQASHVYELDWPGADATIEFSYHDSNYLNNTGSLTVQIFGP